jgi:hypothetical protein
MTCSDCPSPALYVYDPPKIRPTYFCEKHLPSFLKQAAKSGALKTTEKFADVKASALAALAPVVEAVEEPAPKRRRRKKVQVEDFVEVESEDFSEVFADPQVAVDELVNGLLEEPGEDY